MTRSKTDLNLASLLNGNDAVADALAPLLIAADPSLKAEMRAEMAVARAWLAREDRDPAETAAVQKRLEQLERWAKQIDLS